MQWTGVVLCNGKQKFPLFQFPKEGLLPVVVKPHQFPTNKHNPCYSQRLQLQSHSLWKLCFNEISLRKETLYDTTDSISLLTAFYYQQYFILDSNPLEWCQYHKTLNQEIINRVFGILQGTFSVWRNFQRLKLLKKIGICL